MSAAAHEQAAGEHARGLEQHAGAYNAASAALGVPGATAGAGVGPGDRDMSPFEHREDIVEVTPLRRNEFDARAMTPPEMLMGAVVTFRAVPGLTAEWLQRVVDCHLARNAALGHVVPEMRDFPLVPPRVEARVSPAGAGLAGAVSSRDPKVARESCRGPRGCAAPKRSKGRAPMKTLCAPTRDPHRARHRSRLPGLALGVVTAATLLAVTAPAAHALPSFARKYKMDCGACHEPTIPRLNAVGYKFRRAGYRFPEAIGKDEATEFNLGDYFSGQIESAFSVSRSSQAGASSTEARFEGPEIGLHALTGSFARFFASSTEVALGAGEVPEIENAYVRAVYGSENQWLQTRVGVFHPIEGYGGSDQPIALAAPLFETESAAQTQQTFVGVAELNRLGAEVGAQWRNTSINVAVLNRLVVRGEEGVLAGNGTLPADSNPTDLLVSAQQLIGDHSSVGAYWLRGSIDLPIDPAAFAEGTSSDTWRDSYDRIGLFGSAGTGRWLALAGAALGVDRSRDPATAAITAFESTGAFVEGEAALGAHGAGYLRLDYYDPSTSLSSNRIFTGRLGSRWSAGGLFFLTPELRLRRDESETGDRTEAALVVHALVAY